MLLKILCENHDLNGSFPYLLCHFRGSCHSCCYCFRLFVIILRLVCSLLLFYFRGEKTFRNGFRLELIWGGSNLLFFYTGYMLFCMQLKVNPF